MIIFSFFFFSFKKKYQIIIIKYMFFYFLERYINLFLLFSYHLKIWFHLLFKFQYKHIKNIIFFKTIVDEV